MRNEGARLFPHDVSRETRERLEKYRDLVIRWTPKINLVSKSTLPTIWSRHFEDSAQLLDLVGGPVDLWADLGSGGGFPGLVIAALDYEEGRIGAMTLVESDHRKAAFLRTVIRELELSATVIAARIEEVPGLGADIVSARALAPLPDLLALAERHLAPGGRALFPKGARHLEEVKDALESWRFRCETHASLTDPQAVILSVSEIERA